MPTSLADFNDSNDKNRSIQKGLYTLDDSIFIKKTWLLIPIERLLNLYKELAIVEKLPLAQKTPTPSEEYQFIVIEEQETKPGQEAKPEQKIKERHTTFVTNPSEIVRAIHKECDRVQIIRVRTCPIPVKVEVGKCELGDTNEISVIIDLQVQVQNMRQLWQANDDPLKTLEDRIKECCKRFFRSITKNDLLTALDDIVLTSQLSARKYQLKQIKEELEAEVLPVQVLGLAILGTHANLDISSLSQQPNTQSSTQNQESSESSKTLKVITDRKLMYANRQHINSLLDIDTTFAPYKLRDVILALDNRLLENFYTSEWSVAMKEVQNLFWQKKNEYLRGVDDDERMRQFAKLSESMGMKHEVQPKLQVMMNKRLTERERSIHDFLHSLVGMSTNEVK